MKKFNFSKLKKIISEIFLQSGSNVEESEIIANHLVEANLIGHDSHGVIRVKQYIESIKKGDIKLNQQINIIKEEDSFIHVDGNQGHGQSIIKQTMDLGIKKTKKNGHCILAIKNLGHIGRLGAWSEMAAKKNCVSILFTNTSGFGILMAPYGGLDRRLSANPITIGIPTENNDYIILDMATSSVAEGKIKVAKNKNIKLANDLILDGYGNPTNDPNKFYSEPQGSILPFGGHKGFALAFMIDILAGSLTGGNSSHPKNENSHLLINNSFGILIDINKTVSNDYFFKDVKKFTEWVKESPKNKEINEIRIPGEGEKRIKAERLKSGIPLDEKTINEIIKSANSIGLNQFDVNYFHKTLI